MLKKIQERKDAKRLMQLIPRFRAGETCSAADIWFMEMCLSFETERRVSVELLIKIQNECVSSSRDAWLQSLSYWHMVDSDNEDELFPKMIEILKPYQSDPLCASLLGSLGLQSDLTKSILGVPLKLLQQSVDAGCARGMVHLSKVYDDGELVQKDRAKSYALIYRAAGMFDPEAIYMLSDKLLRGKGAKVDTSAAILFLEKAAAFDNCDAYRSLGICYRDGLRVKVDNRKAASLFRKAAVAGYWQHSVFSYLDKIPSKFTIPWGEWCPDPLMHRYVTPQMHRAMRTLLLMRTRQGSLFAMLPKDIVLSMCSWLCTYPKKAPQEKPLLMAITRQGRQIAQLERKIDMLMQMMMQQK